MGLTCVRRTLTQFVKKPKDYKDLSFKALNLADDFAPLTTAINETIVVTGSIVSGQANVKYFRNVASGSAGIDLGGYFQTVYDSAPTSSLASPIVDFAFGIATGSVYNSPVTATSSLSDKVKVYRQWAAVLLGNPDATFTINAVSRKEALFISWKRNLIKDEIKKGTVGIVFNSLAPAQFTGSDAGSAVNFQAVLRSSNPFGAKGRVHIILVKEHLGF